MGILETAGLAPGGSGKEGHLKLYGIRKRWMFNGFLVILISIAAFMTAYGILVHNYYYSEIETGIKAKAKTASNFFANYNTKSYDEYYKSAERYTEEFNDRDRLELQFINAEGYVLVSTYGLTANTKPETTDIEAAINSGEIQTWIGKNPRTGEKIISVSSPMIYSNGQVIGVMRYVSGLKVVDGQILKNVLTALVIRLALVLFVFLTNLYFIRSITDPIMGITKIAGRISEGSYGEKIEWESDDEIGKLASTINEMSLKISRSEKIKSEFISSVSHELRTPLTAITGWGETLIYDESLNEESRRGVEIILNEAKRLTKMVEELLEFTKMEDGRFTLNVEDTDAIAVLEDAIFTYGELLRHEEIELRYEPSEQEAPSISGDPERLKQVYLNLLDNAAKYGREGKRIVVSSQVEPDAVVVKFRDFGPGIPEDELDSVKMKFYKGSSKERGSGIGLSVCDEIIQRHRGEFILENAEGGGLIATVKLPV